MLLPVLLGISVIVFLVMHLAPGDPALILAGPTATASEIAAIREKLGLNEPIYVQYWRFLSNALRGDLGESVRPVSRYQPCWPNAFPTPLPWRWQQ